MDIKKKKDNEDLPRDLRELLPILEARFEELQRKFDNFFLGLEKRPPLRERDDLHRRLMKLVDIKGYQYNFIYRAKQLILKFNTYNAMWERMLRRLEEGEPLEKVRRMGAGLRRSKEKKSEEKREEEKREKEWLEVSSPAELETGLDRLYDWLRRESEKRGMRVMDREAFKKKLLPQLKEKATSKLKMKVDLSSGKPKIKIKKER